MSDDEQIYGNSVSSTSFQQPGPHESGGRNGMSSPAYFIITAETEEEGRKFLKVWQLHN